MKVSDGLVKVSDGLGKVSDGLMNRGEYSYEIYEIIS